MSQEPREFDELIEDSGLVWPPKGHNRYGEETRYAGTEYGETRDLARTPGVGPGLRKLLVLFACVLLSWGVVGGAGWLLWCLWR